MDQSVNPHIGSTLEDLLMLEEPEFRPFSHIRRWNREIIITEKIDGTNGLIHVSGSGEVRAGSRNRWITPGKTTDNFGFAQWVADHEAELRDGLGEGYHYGEWWGSGIGRGYGLGGKGKSERYFSLFNVARWGEGGTAVRPACCLAVPVLLQATPNDPVQMGRMIADSLARLASGGSVAAPGFMRPEGIVIYHVASGQLFKMTHGGDGHKGEAAK